MKFASRSAIESVSSANCASSALSGKLPLCELWYALFCELRREERDEGRRGVVGREMGERCGRRLREFERGAEAVSIVMKLDEAGCCAITNVRELELFCGSESGSRTRDGSSGRCCTLTTSSQGLAKRPQAPQPRTSYDFIHCTFLVFLLYVKLCTIERNGYSAGAMRARSSAPSSSLCVTWLAVLSVAEMAASIKETSFIEPWITSPPDKPSSGSHSGG
jgi:hypothetical protein